MAKLPASNAIGREGSAINLMRFFNSRVRVYPKSVRGPARTVKWAVLAVCLGLYYIVPWFRWNRGPGVPDQMILLDLPNRRFYFASLELWPQDIYILAGGLIFSAVLLFLVTSLFGRIWCGYSCPQTVWTDLFMLVERTIEGDRNERMRRDQGPTTFAKVWRKTAKHTVWVLIAFWTGGAWIMYYADAPTVTVEFWTGTASTAVYFFTGLFTVLTYLLAGWAREQVCTFMCPWPRFQAAMLDEQSMTVTYEAWRGEPRGHGKRDAAHASKLGHCVDCSACVQVCPTGIDIRDGIQLECINCGLCVDACNEIMERTHQPKWLVTWDTEARQRARATGQPVPFHLWRVRTAIYATVLVIVAAGAIASLVIRPLQELSVQHDRAPLFVLDQAGDLRNGYVVKVSNKTLQPASFDLTTVGVPAASLRLAENGGAPGPSVRLDVPADSVGTFRVLLTAQPGGASRDVNFSIEKVGTGTRTIYKSIFLGPG